MAGLPAELHRLHHLDALVGCAGDNHDIDHRRAEEDHRPASRLRIVQIEYRQQRRRLAAGYFAQAAAVQDRANRDQDQAGHEDRRQYQVGQDAEIRSALEAELFHYEQTDDEHQARDGQPGANQARGVSGYRRQEVLEHSFPRFSMQGQNSNPALVSEQCPDDPDSKAYANYQEQ